MTYAFAPVMPDVALLDGRPKKMLVGGRWVDAVSGKTLPTLDPGTGRHIADIAAGVALPEGRVSSVVRLGGVYAEVLEEADKIAADLIVVGSHRPKMSTYLLGSNAASIVRHAHCSVLVIRK